MSSASTSSDRFHTWDLPTPAVVIDGAVVRQNVERLAAYAAEKNVAVRPHTKTHKLRTLAEMQLDAGAIGLTVAKVSEADAITAAGDDVLLAYPPVGRERAARVAALARDRTVRAAVDSLTAVEASAAAAQAAGVTIGLLVDLDVGLGRTGAQSPVDALALAQAIDRAAGLRLDGLMIYPGHIAAPPDEQSAALAAVDALLAETLDLWRRHGLAAPIVSGGSTPTAYRSHLVTRQTEIRPGTYVFNDWNTVRGGWCQESDCAVRVLATVISNAAPGQAVIDAGSKTLSSDQSQPAPGIGFGRVVEYPAARIAKLNEEHGQIDVSACEAKPAVGDVVSVIPNHVCPCINLQSTVLWCEEGEPPRQWTVDARGRLQ